MGGEGQCVALRDPLWLSLRVSHGDQNCVDYTHRIANWNAERIRQRSMGFLKNNSNPNPNSHPFVLYLKKEICFSILRCQVFKPDRKVKN